MRKCWLVAGLVAVAAIAAGCSEPVGPAAGTVTRHRYDDPDTWTTSYCGYRDSKSGLCYYWVDDTHHDGPHWWLHIEGADTNEDGNPDKAGWREVDQATYERCTDGAWCNTEAA